MTLTNCALAFRGAGFAFKDAWRAVVRAPRTAAVVIPILAVGIAATSVTFSIIDAVLLKPLPYERSHELVQVRGRDHAGATGLSLHEFRALQNFAPGLASLGLVRFNTAEEVRIEDVVVRGDVAHATAGYVHALRLAPIIGRLWTSEEESKGESVAAIGYDLWRHKLGGNVDTLGAVVTVGGTHYRVIGVMPQKATHLDGTPVAVWVPLPQVTETEGSSSARNWRPIGRIRDGMSLSDVEAHANGVLARYIPERPAADRNWKVEVARIDADLLGAAEGWLVPAFIAVLSLLLVSYFNAANVLLARANQRVSEFAIRAALGGTRAHLGLSVLIESLLLSAVACLVALVLISWGIGTITPLLPPMFRSHTISFDVRVFVVSMCVALIGGCACGLLASLRASGTSSPLAHSASRSMSASKRRWQEGFLISEIAGVAVVLIVATLFVTSFVRVVFKDLGFDRSMLLAVSTLTNYEGNVDDVSTQFGAIPGVRGVAAITGGMPPLVGDAFGGAHLQSQLRRPDGPSDAPTITADIYAVSANFFTVAGISLLRGRTWDPRITADGAIVDDVTGRGLFGYTDPIGRQVIVQKVRGQVFTVVGLIPRQFLRGPERERASVFIALSPTARPKWVGFLFRTSSPPELVVDDVKRVSAAIAPPDPSPGAGVHVVSDAFSHLTARRRFTAKLMVAMGFVAIVIGAAGMYAVIYSIVSQRVREIAIRLAIGATPSAIRAGVLLRSVQLLAAGLALGLFAGWCVSRLFESMLFMVTGADPLVYGVVAGLLTAVGVAAAMGPAWYASRVDPNKVLQQL